MIGGQPGATDGDLARTRGAIEAALTSGDTAWQALAEVVAALEGIVRAARAAQGVELSEYVVEALAGALVRLSDRDARLRELAQRALAAHAVACRLHQGDPERLAQWLVRLQLEHPEGPEVRLTDYAGALGSPGLAHYRALVETMCAELDVVEFGRTPWFDRYRWAVLRVTEDLAEHLGDVDLHVLALGKDLSSGWHYLRIATLLQEAGRSEQVLEWVGRGLAASGWRGAAARLVDVAVDECVRMGWFDRAVSLRMRIFTSQPGMDSYLRLRAVAEHGGHWPDHRETVLRRLREGATDVEVNSLLVRVLIQDGQDDAAWQAAMDNGCTDAVWAELARIRSASHPRDAIAVYRGLVEQELVKDDHRHNEELVVELLAQLRTLFTRTGRQDAFNSYLEGVKSRHVADRQLLDELTKRGL
ncbi:hypothetical protein GCM10010174_01590 [Kutzneria viridogrisea]|uniref:Uncharacterized protein n=2 Tax=Kutzneria TaxID=43356 RepID=W5WB43_9PSEU|nr:hypothetical protein [Kutzneria albida]AHH97736.1 hypothetical protein KALB_4374 [Kutzneria albida DSM 43870]MBA8924678.1 hypothetical protein [Kutzneria viridogrisea]